MTRDEIILRARGQSDAAIAKQMRLSRQRVHQLLGARPPRKPPARQVEPAGPTRADFARSLREWRTGRGITQAEAARLLLVNKQVLSNWETGRNGCSLAASMLRLMELLPLPHTASEIMLDKVT